MAVGKVVFIGAGPGDPDLMTIRGVKYLQQADVVVYASSLINKDVLKWVKPGAEVYDSAVLTTEEIVEILVKAAGEGKLVARLKSGDPAIYGALWEEIIPLKTLGIPYEIVPGVTAALAAAASLEIELTVPKIAQHVIITRASQRVPMKGTLRDVAAFMKTTGATAVIYTGVHVINQVVRELLDGGLPPDMPVAVVYKASWPHQKIIKGTLLDISEKVREEKITKQSVIIVGEAVNPKEIPRSSVYDPSHSHSYRSSKVKE